MGRKRRISWTAVAWLCAWLVHGASAQEHSAAWSSLDFQQESPHGWGGSLRSTFGRGESHDCLAWWQLPGRSPGDSANVDLRFTATWSGWSGLTATTEARLSARLPLTAQHALRLGLGALHDQTGSRFTPTIQCVFEGPLGPAAFRLLLRSVPAPRSGHPMQRLASQFVAITVTRTHERGWGSCWLAWNGHGFRLAATAWHELNGPRSIRMPTALGLRLTGAPWGLQLGGVWGIGTRQTTHWAGIDAWGGSQFSLAW